MAATSRRWPGIAVLAAGLWLVTGAPGTRAADEEKSPLRAELLKLNTATTEDSQNAKFKALIKDRTKAKAAVAEAAKMMKEAKDKDEKPFNYNGTLILARAAHVVRDYDAAEKFYEHQVELATKVKSGLKIVQAYEGLIDLYFDSKRYADAIDTCEKVMDLTGPKEVDEAKPFILEKLIQAKARSGKIDEAMTITKNLIDRTDGSWYFIQLRGWVQREAGKIDDAIKTYTEVLDKLDADKGIKGESKDKLKDRVRYTLSGLHVENKDIEKAAKQLETLIKRNPDEATYKNDLGFIWCDHDMKLEESEKLIKEALELDKKKKEKLKEEGKLDEVTENAAYLDSLGWVLFKQKKYKEALEPLKKAAADEDEGNHLEIWDHLGDCHMALGQKKEAVAAWEKALKMEDLSKRDGERRRKVSEKLKKAKTETTKD
jgi:tetratricopeptide (TPR) repeat protein